MNANVCMNMWRIGKCCLYHEKYELNKCTCSEKKKERKKCETLEWDIIQKCNKL